MLHNPYVFYAAAVVEIGSRTEKHQLEANLEEAKIHRHDLRHTFASLMFMKGINIVSGCGHHSLDDRKVMSRSSGLQPRYMC